MRQVRHNIFETNSSSTHSLTICTKDEYNNWLNGNVLFDRDMNKFVENVTISSQQYKEAENYYNRNKLSYYKDWKDLSDKEKEDYTVKYLKDTGEYDDTLYTHEEWVDSVEYETFRQDFTTPSGDKMVAFGYYGYV